MGAMMINRGVMNGFIYDATMRLIERKLLGKIRRELLSPLRGAIVEVGAGTGANFPHYESDAHVLALEPDPDMLARALVRAKRSRATIDLRVADDAALDQLEPESADAVVFPLVLCTIDDPLRALNRARRVIRRNGRVIVLEHIRGQGRVGTFQDAILPIWRCIGGGCRPNRETERLLQRSGFEVDCLEQRHITDFAPIQDLLIGYATLSNTR